MAPRKRASSTYLASALIAATSLLLLLLLPRDSSGFVHSPHSSRQRHAFASLRYHHAGRGGDDARRPDEYDNDGPGATAASSNDRRIFLASMTTHLASSTIAFVPFAALASDAMAGETMTTTTTKSTADAVITDRIFIEFKGLSSSSSSPENGNGDDVAIDRIVIGLFGNDSPQPVSVLRGLVTKAGYPSKCKALDLGSRMLEKERLEARKVYNSCLETEDARGVNYEYSTVWRVIKDDRIDLGAVSGKFVARENPTFVDGPTRMRHDAPGVVSVRRGDGGGYGFTIYPGRGGDDDSSSRATSSSSSSSTTLDDDNIVVGRVIEGMDVVKKLNDVTVVRNAGAMLSSSGRELRGMPSRSCRYGGSEYFCNENKPLRKILLDRTGVL